MAKHKIGWQTSKIERLSYYLFFAGQLIFNTCKSCYDVDRMQSGNCPNPLLEKRVSLEECLI